MCLIELFDTRHVDGPVRLAVAELWTDGHQADKEELLRAISVLDRTELDGHEIKVREHQGERTRSKAGDRNGNRATVSGTPWTAAGSRSADSKDCSWQQADASWGRRCWGDSICDTYSGSDLGGGCGGYGGGLGSGCRGGHLVGSDRSEEDRERRQDKPGWGARRDNVEAPRSRSRKSDCRHGSSSRRQLLPQPPPPASRDTVVRLRRLVADKLPLCVDWRMLKDMFQGQFHVYVDIVHVRKCNKPAACGIIKFRTCEDAQQANIMFNGALLGGKKVRLQPDRGEFDELMASKRPITANEEAAPHRALPRVPLEFNGHAVPPPPPPSQARVRTRM